MLSLPWKQSKKVRIVEKSAGRYSITFISPFKDEAEFLQFIEEELKICLGPQDRLTDPDWENKCVKLMTLDLDNFKNKILFSSIIIEKDQ